MTEKQEYTESDDDRRIVVGNLPTNCEKEFLENFFESRKQFGDGITVESIDFENDEAIITFEQATDVDQILQRHVKKPCVLGKKELTIKPLKSYSDTVDGGSFVVVCDRSQTNTSRDSHYSSMQSSLLSLNSIASVDSSELFGSGESRYQNFSKVFEELHLVYHQPGREKCVIKLCETDVSPVIVSYAATTCSADKATHESLRKTPNKPQTLLQETLRTQFDGEVDIKTEAFNIIVTLIGKVETINNVQDFQKAVMATLKSFEGIVAVQLHESDAERFDLALKHFLPLLHSNHTIKMFRADDEFSFFVAYQTKHDKNLVDIHIAIVKDQAIIRQEKPLQMKDYYKVKAYRSVLDNQSAMITIDENRVVIEGFIEDLNTTVCAVNRVLHTSHFVTKRMDAFAIDQLKDEGIVTEIRHLLTKNNLKVWWEVSGNFLNVVGKNEKQVIKAAELISAFFSTYSVEIPDYLLDSPKWERTKTLAFLKNQRRLFVDDKTDRHVVVIKGTAEVCKIFAETTEDLKKECTRVKTRKTLSEAKCGFALKYLQEDEENMKERDYLKLQQGSNKTELIVEGTEVAQQKIESKFKEISTLKFWVCDEKAVDRLRTLPEEKESRPAGTVHVFENHTRVIFKNGRIEDEQADVIVNSAAQDLNLSTGDNTVTHSISNAAGEQAQKCLERFKRPVPAGTVIAGDAGNMKCKAIFHAVLDKFNPIDNSSIENLRKVVTSCLATATTRGFVSIVFPALCTGVHGYPIKTVAETMLNSITAYCCQNELPSLKEVVIIFLEGDNNKKKAFEDCRSICLQKLEGMKTEKILTDRVPWPCRFFCHITAATHADASKFSEQVNAELMEQTFLKTE
ncbi:uncharacterized protein LOC123547186 [Mercenaria mercenaria]|uniref:uncharacterized protein LOC123547186 n=1 Tax=Mercenaria mercenaria TaxID=6596 RepID=UPI00234E760F|nr:uncharacterized protein LOC123547186 [Mercenaria mercenaria]